MSAPRTHIVESSEQPGKEKQEWAEEHARRLQRLFEQWQNPLGINGSEYRKHLKAELSDCYDQPLRKSLIEQIV